MNHVWVAGQVKNFNTSRSSGQHRRYGQRRRSLNARSNRRKIQASRKGYICAGCKLTAVPPRKADGWEPPLGTCL